MDIRSLAFAYLKATRQLQDHEATMLGQMRSHSNRPRRPCPCGGVCSCHKPQPDKETWLGLAVTLLCFFGVMGAGLALTHWAASHFPDAPRTIHVNGQVCVIHFVETGRGYRVWGTSYPVGHDEAVCPKQ